MVPKDSLTGEVGLSCSKVTDVATIALSDALALGMRDSPNARTHLHLPDQFSSGKGPNDSVTEIR